MENERKELGKCPECGKPVYEGKKAFYCSGYKEGCRFVLWKNCLEPLGYADITPAQAGILLKNEAIPLIGLKSKNGKIFDAEGKLSQDDRYGWQIGLIFGDFLPGKQEPPGQGNQRRSNNRQFRTDSEQHAE